MRNWTLCIIVLLSFFPVISCTNKNQVEYGGGQCYQLEKGEVNVDPITDAELEEYEMWSYMDSAGLMLNRVIYGKNNIYISLSFDVIPKEIGMIQGTLSDFTLIDENEFGDKEVKYHSYLLKKKDKFLYRVSFLEPVVSGTVVFDVWNEDSTRIANWFENKNKFLQSQCR